MPQTVPWVKTLCSYRATSAPSVRGSSRSARIVFVGWLPANVRCGTSSGGTPSAATSSPVLPKASASVWAMKFAVNRSWWPPFSPPISSAARTNPMKADEHLAKSIGPDRDHQAQPDRGIVRITAADPVPEAEHVDRIDLELADLLLVRRDGHKVAGDGRWVSAEAGEEPLPGGLGIRDRLDRREGLGRHDEQRLGRVEVAGRLVDVG